MPCEASKTNGLSLLIVPFTAYPFSSALSYVFNLSSPTRFPTAGLPAACVPAGWLLDRSMSAKYAQLLITYYLATAYPTHQRSKYDEGWANWSNG